MQCYDDEMINFWPLLHPLTDGKGTTTRCLAHHLLSTWHWSSITHPTSCPPAPTNMEIGRWLPLDRDGNREDLWIEAYACCLQCVAEASTGWSWVTEGEGMAPQVSPLVQAFLFCHRKACKPIHSAGVLATKTQYCTNAADGRSPSSHNPMPGRSCHTKPFVCCMGYVRVARFQQELLERRLLPLLPRFNGRPQFENAGDPIGIT